MLLMIRPPAMSFAQVGKGLRRHLERRWFLAFKGAVEVQRAENARWDPAYTNQVLDAGNRLRTDKNSLALLRFSDLETIRVGPRSLIRIESKGERRRGFDFFKGVLYFFHRDKPDEFEVRTPQMGSHHPGNRVHAGSGRGWHQHAQLAGWRSGISNSLGQLDLKSGEQAIVEPGKAPRRTAIIEAVRSSCSGASIIRRCSMWMN